MMHRLFRFVLLSVLLASLSACGGGSSGSGPTPSPEPGTGLGATNTNNKTILFESDFALDDSLRVTASDVGIFSLNNLAELDERIPFSVAQPGDFEICVEGAGNILSIAIRNNLDQLVATIDPIYSLDCFPVSLPARDYLLELNYVKKIPNQAVRAAAVPFVRLDERSELKEFVATSDWNEQFDAEISRAGPDPEVDDFPGLRTCYRTPVSNVSRASFRVEANRLRLSYKPDLSLGSDFLCTYQIIFAFLGPGDIGDIDTIVAGLVNRPIVSSRPRAGNQSVSILSDINIQFRDSIDSASISGLSLGASLIIAPAVSGTIGIQGQVANFRLTPGVTFTPDTTYAVTLKGLRNNSGVIGDIGFSFKTEKALNLSGDEERLSDADLCTLGLSEFCAEIHFANITDIRAAISGSSASGSRLLEVSTALQQPTIGDIIIEYELIDDRDNSVVAADLFVIGFGQATGQNILAWPIDDFDRTIHTATLRITKINNAFGVLQEAGSWAVYNGEVYGSPTEVVTSEAGAPTITGISLSGNISSGDLGLTAQLDRPATEDVHIEFLIEGGCQWSELGVPVCLDPGVVTLPAGARQIQVVLVEPEGFRSSTGPITVTVSNTRNVNPGAGVSAFRLLDQALPGPGPDPGGAI